MSGFREISDRNLLKLLASGHKEAFDELYTRYASIVYRTAWRFLQSEAGAADLTQELFIKLWTHREKFTDIDNMRSYISIMSRNLAIRALRDQANRNHARSEWAVTVRQESVAGADHLLHLQGMEQFFRDTVNQLPPQQQKVYRMAREEGLTYKNIAQLLNISPVTVKQHMIAANRFVRERWEQFREV